MKVRQLSQRIVHIDDADRAHVSVRVQLMDSAENLMCGEQVRVMEEDELIWDTDTDLEGEAQIDFIMDIVQETRKNLIIAAGRESREKVFLLDISSHEVGARVRDIRRRESENMVRVKKCKNFLPPDCHGIIQENGKEYMIGPRGEILSDWYDEITFYTEADAAIVKRGDISSLIDYGGRRLCQWFNDVHKVSWLQQAFVVQQGDRFAIIEVPRCDPLTTWFNQNVLLRAGKRYAILDTKGNPITGWHNEMQVNASTDVSILKQRAGDALFDNRAGVYLPFININKDIAMIEREEQYALLDRCGNNVSGWCDEIKHITFKLDSPCCSGQPRVKRDCFKLIKGSSFAVMDHPGHYSITWGPEGRREIGGNIIRINRNGQEADMDGNCQLVSTWYRNP